VCQSKLNALDRHFLICWRLQRPFWPNDLWWRSSFGRVPRAWVVLPGGLSTSSKPQSVLQTYAFQHKNGRLHEDGSALQLSLRTSAIAFSRYVAIANGCNLQSDRIAKRPWGTTRFLAGRAPRNRTSRMTNTLSLTTLLSIQWAQSKTSISMLDSNGVFKASFRSIFGNTGSLHACTFQCKEVSLASCSSLTYWWNV